MERDSENSGVGNTIVQETISDESTGTRQSTGTASEPVGKRVSRQPISDNQLPNTDAITNGEPNDSRIYRENPASRTTESTTRDSEQSRVSSDSDLRQDVESARTTEIIEDSRQRDAEALYARQLEANKTITTNFADKDNIEKALPVLFDAQIDDVYKAEKRFYKDKKNGMMFTNGTGTGKTGTGSGVVRRFVSAGKNNIIIVVPNNSIAGDWLDFLKNKLDVSARQLTGITDSGGEGVVVTTYANFGLNDAITKRANDLIVADESHYLSSEENGGNTNYLNKLRLLTGHKRGKHYFAESYFDTEYKEYSDNVDNLYDKIEKLDSEKDKVAIEGLRNKIDKLHKKWRLKEEEANAIFDKRPKSKVVMLSATPFSYVKSVDYAEGYLFDYSTIPDSDTGGYNSGNARERFFMENFGYRMRYNKLTRPDGNVNNELMEQQFNEKLQASGALSGRRLDIPYDYDRKFFYTEDAAGTKLDLAFAAISEAQQKDKTLRNIPSLYDLFPHHERMYLLEAIKAKHSVDYIKQNLALGRKIVVFHDFNKGGAWNPYELMLSRIKDSSHRKKIAAILARPEFKADFSDLISPIDRFSRDFDKVLFVNGTLTKKQRRTNLAKFNDDNSGYDLLIAQSDAAREGSSMHDTTSLHKRVLINLGMPTRPVKATQIEGRIYRTGQASDAIFRYFTTGTGWESSAFTHKVAERSGTAENLALGREARALKKSFLDAYANASDIEVSDLDGTGGKEYDQQLAKSSAISPFEAAKTYYYGQQKNAKRRDQREGLDYYATPEPVGFKVTEWADIVRGDKALEPSAGHGAIARFIPEGAKITAIEPSYNLSQRIGLSNADAAIINDRFENHNIVNKYDAIVMNPPYGAGGKTAMEHLQKAIHHLKPNGRVVAIVPIGQFDKRFDKFLESKEASNINIVAKILLPSITFEKAGTGVVTQVLIIDNNTLDQGTTNIDLTRTKTINELFDRIEHIDILKRTRETKEEAEARKEQEKEFKRQQKLAAFEKAKQQELATVDSIDTRSVIKFDEDNNPIFAEHTTKYGKVLKGVIAKLTKTQAQAIDPYAIKKPNGYFIRESYLDENNNFIISNNNTENKPVINLAGDGKSLIVEHITARGKVIKGIVANISKEQAKAIDKYTFQKEGGFFIREEYLDENGNLHLDQQYSRKEINQGSNAVTLRSFINNTTKHWKNVPATTVVQSIEDLPEAIRHKINKDNADDASGIQHNGTVYLIADNIESTQHAS
ncbi:DEAD/DEAH box helicase family protein, partial [Entomomonas asaccharolytica]